MLIPEHISSECILKTLRKESQAQDHFSFGIVNYWGLGFATFTFWLGFLFFFFCMQFVSHNTFPKAAREASGIVFFRLTSAWSHSQRKACWLIGFAMSRHETEDITSYCRGYVYALFDSRHSPIPFFVFVAVVVTITRVQAILCYPKRESKHMTRKEVIGFGDFASLAITG